MKNQPLKISKSTVEKIIIAVIVLSALSYGSWMFLLSPLEEQKAAILAERSSVDATLTTNKSLVAAAAKTKANYEPLQKALAAQMLKDMPPRINELAWAGDFFRQVAATADTGVHSARSISATGTLTIPAARDGQVSIFEAYGVKTDYQCELHEFGHYLAALEAANTLMRVDGIEISSSFQGGETEKIEQTGRLNVTLRTLFLRFTEQGFLPEERPDAPLPRVAPKEAPKTTGAAAGE